MGIITSIGWCDTNDAPGGTHNRWHGCMKVAPECDHCYALTQSTRFYKEVIWGPPTVATRRVLSEHNRDELFIAHRKAVKEGIRRRFFFGSMADVCDNHPVAMQERPRLIADIEQLTQFDCLLLSKRPGNYNKYFWSHWPSHVWAGTSAGSPHSAELMLPKLAQVDAPIRFLSLEPFIEYFDVRPYLPDLDWVIIGGESDQGGQKNARLMDPEWALRVIEYCRDARVKVFMKQLGSRYADLLREAGVEIDPKGEHRLDAWPKELRIQEFPTGVPNPHRRNPYSV